MTKLLIELKCSSFDTRTFNDKNKKWILKSKLNFENSLDDEKKRFLKQTWKNFNAWWKITNNKKDLEVYDFYFKNYKWRKQAQIKTQRIDFFKIHKKSNL